MDRQLDKQIAPLFKENVENWRSVMCLSCDIAAMKIQLIYCLDLWLLNWGNFDMHVMVIHFYVILTSKMAKMFAACFSCYQVTKQMLSKMFQKSCETLIWIVRNQLIDKWFQTFFVGPNDLFDLSCRALPSSKLRLGIPLTATAARTT